MTKDNKYEKIFSNNLKHLRKQKNLSQQQMAIKFRVSESCYAKWEQGNSIPNSIDKLATLTEMFEISLHDLLLTDITILRNAA